MKEIINFRKGKQMFWKKSVTNNGDPAKHEARICVSDNMEASLIIYKYVLAPESETLYSSDFTPVKKYKNQVLYFQRFSIKLTTLNDILNWLCKL